MQGCMSLAVISIVARSAQRAGFKNGSSHVGLACQLARSPRGDITLEEFFENQEHLAKSRTNGEETLLAGPAREGLALLQGLLLCGTCGRALTIRYTGNGGIYPCYLCNRLRREGWAS